LKTIGNAIVEITKTHIFDELKKTMSQLFELNSDTIHLDSKLYEELNLDSIDAVDLIAHLQTTTGRKFNPEEFKSVRNVADVVDVIYTVITHKDNETP